MARSFIFTSFAKMIEFIKMLRFLELKRDEMVLDLGCGEGSNDVALSLTGARIYGVDIDGRTLSSAKSNANNLGVSVDYTVSDLNQAVAFKSQSFDKAVSFCVLEHLAKPETFLHEVNRILRPKGVLALSVDSFSYGRSPEKFTELHGKLCHVRKYYSKREAELLLRKCNFSLEDWGFSIKSPLSSCLFRALLRAYFRSSLFGRPFSLWILKLVAPVTLLVAVVSDSLHDDEQGGYWLTLLAVKEE
ncbi:MAG: class I SAM-dependent methyltransferase [Thermodesulfobacteriota bacterium]|nr:class I SAM-dependent methyltransferase [Thermodesulfobacteriota bacterium]